MYNQTENMNEFPENFTFININEDFKNNEILKNECSKLRNHILEKYDAAVKSGKDSFVFHCKEYSHTAIEIVINEMLGRGFAIAIPKSGNYGHIDIHRIFKFDIDVVTKYYYVPLTKTMKEHMYQYDFPFPKKEN